MTCQRYNRQGRRKQTQESTTKAFEPRDPKASRDTGTNAEEKKRAQPQTGTAAATERSIKEERVSPWKYLPSRSLGEQQRTRTVHITLSLYKCNTEFPVGTSKKQPLVIQGECEK
jgi:hypothetical protein